VVRQVTIDYYLNDWTWEGTSGPCPGCLSRGNIWAWGDDYYQGPKYVCVNCSHSFSYGPGLDEHEVARMIRDATKKGGTHEDPSVR